MSSKHAGECPYCNSTMTPILLEENAIRRDLCACSECGEKLLVCRTPGCQDYAKGGDLYDDELCPSCTSSVTSGAGEVLKWGLMSAAGILATILVAKKDE